MVGKKVGIMKFMNKKLSVLVALTIASASQVGFAQTSETEDCICDGKLTTLTLRYISDEATSITVIQKDGVVLLTDGDLLPGEVFALTGNYKADKKPTLGPYIDAYLGNGTIQNIHTSCSIEINVGDVIGDFRVIAGTSYNNGAICENDEPPACDPDVEECDDPGGEG